MRALILAMLITGCGVQALPNNPPDAMANSQPAAASCAVDCGNGGEAVCEPAPANGYRYCCEGFTPYPMTYGGVTHNICVPCGGVREPCCNASATAPGPTCDRGLTCIVGDWTCH